MLFYDLIWQFKPTALVRFTDIYFSAPEQVNVGIDPPGVPLWALNASADCDLNGEKWIYLADRAHNPERQVKWSGIILDDVWQKLFVSVMTPIDYHGAYVATIRNELFLDDLVGSLLKSGIDGAWHTVFREDGRLIAYTGKLEEIKQSEGHLTIQAARDPSLLALLEDARRARARETRPVFSGYDRRVDLYYAVSRMRARIGILLPRSPATGSATKRSRLRSGRSGSDSVR